MMMKKKLWILIAALALGLTACGGGEEKPANPAGAEQSAASGEKDADQHFNTFFVEEPTTLNSARGTDTSSNRILINSMEPLTRLVEQENGTLKAEPAGAESWQVSEDGLTWTFKLRDNKWSDGQPVTAKDYEFGIKTAAASPDGMAFLIDCVKGVDTKDANQVAVKAIDDKTLEIVLNEPAPYFIQLTSSRPTLPIRQDKYEAAGERYGTEADTLVTCGPFKIDSWVHQSDIQLSKHQEYWDAANVAYEKVSWRIMTDENTRMNAFLNGEIDTVGSNKKEWQEQFKNMPNVTHKETTSPALDFFLFNTKKAPFNNPKVRLAFSLALNREEAIQAIYNGVGEPATGWVVPGIQVGEKAEGDYRSLVPGPLAELKEKYKDPKALLEEGLKEEGIKPEDFEVRLDFGGTSEEMKQMGDYFLDSFGKSLGIKVTVSLNEWAAFSDQINAREFSVGYMAWNADYNDPYALLSLSMTDINGLSTDWSNAEYDKLVKEAKQAKDQKEMLDKYAAAEKILMEESPVIPIFFPKSNSFRYNYIKGHSYNEFSTQGWKYGYTSGR